MTDARTAAADPAPPWYRELTRYHWFVLIVAALGWLFDTMDQQLFVLARNPALKELLGPDADLTRYGGYATGIFMVGWATGGLVFGLFGDRWGRARTMLITILVYSVFTGLSALSVGWWDFAFYRFVTGMGVGGEFAAGVALVAEVMPVRARPYALGFLQALSAVGNMTAAVISLRLPPSAVTAGVSGWRLMFLIGVIPALLAVVVRSRLKEPDTWVAAKAAAARAARLDDMHRQLGDLRELFRDRRWRRNVIVGVLLASAGVMGLWGVGFWTPELVRENVLRDLTTEEKDRWSSIILLLQNFGAFFGIYAFSRISAAIGRRGAFAVALLLGFAATIMVFGFMTDQSQIYWMAPIFGFCGLMVFGGYAIYFPELFPTRLRSTGTGFCYNVARYIAAFAPLSLGPIRWAYLAPEGTERHAQGLSDLTLLSSLGSVDNAFRYACLSVALVFIVGLLILPFAPETRGKPLPE